MTLNTIKCKEESVYHVLLKKIITFVRNKTDKNKFRKKLDLTFLVSKEEAIMTEKRVYIKHFVSLE